MQNEENDKSFDDVEHFKLCLAGQSQTRTTSTGDDVGYAHMMMIRSMMVNGVIPFVINLFIINIIKTRLIHARFHA